MFLILILIILSVHLFKINRGKYVSILIVIMIVLVVIFFGLSGEKRWYEYYYIIDIDPKDNGDYELYLPIPLDSKNEVHEILDDLKVEGEDVQTEITNVGPGMGLRINARGNVHIYAEMVSAQTTFYGDPMDYPDEFHLSMYNHSSEGFSYSWMYLNTSSKFAVKFSLHAVVERGSSSGKIIWMPWKETTTGPTYDVEMNTYNTGWMLAPAMVSYAED